VVVLLCAVPGSQEDHDSKIRHEYESNGKSTKLKANQLCPHGCQYSEAQDAQGWDQRAVTWPDRDEIQRNAASGMDRYLRW